MLLLIALFTPGLAARPHAPAVALPRTFVPPPILMYHRVDPVRPADPVGRDLTLTPAEFSAQLAYLRSRGIAGISMAQLLARLQSGAPLDHVVVLTFDDGYADQYAYVVPLLHEYGDEATFYVVTGTLGAAGHLTWAQLQLMRSLGEDIAAHGVEHEDLSRMSEAGQAYQIDGSVSLLRRRLDAPVESYCYPGGRFNRTTLRLLPQAGIDLAVTTDRRYVIGPENRFELPRIRVRSGWSVQAFGAAIRWGLERAQIVRR